MNKIVICFIVLLFIPMVNAMPQESKPFNGQILFTPLNSTETYLMDSNCNVIKSWDSKYTSGFGTYLENNNLVRMSIPYINSYFNIGGKTGQVEKFDWNGNLIWNFTLSDSKHILHHDVKTLSNGNILMLAWENKSYNDCINVGRNPNNLSYMILDYIIEVNQNKQIVWQWHLWNHIIQDYDSSKDNYGNVSEHPELIDINCVPVMLYGDWSHCNSLDYNEKTNQILLSSRNLNEIFIINHNNGNIIYRYGNSRNYRSFENQTLFGQHDAQWIKEGYVGEGNIILFNNGNGRNYSTIDEITNNEIIWSYNTSFFASYISGVERLPNGNTIFCNGPEGKIYEITYNKQIIWNYTCSDKVFKFQYYNIYNQPPKYITIDGPTNGKAGISYKFIFNSIDDEKIRYIIDWGNGKETTSFIDGSITLSHMWFTEGIHTIKVIAEDVYNAKSNESIFNINVPKLYHNTNVTYMFCLIDISGNGIYEENEKQIYFMVCGKISIKSLYSKNVVTGRISELFDSYYSTDGNIGILKNFIGFKYQKDYKIRLIGFVLLADVQLNG